MIPTASGSSSSMTSAGSIVDDHFLASLDLASSSLAPQQSSFTLNQQPSLDSHSTEHLFYPDVSATPSLSSNSLDMSTYNPALFEDSFLPNASEPYQTPPMAISTSNVSTSSLFQLNSMNTPPFHQTQQSAAANQLAFAQALGQSQDSSVPLLATQNGLPARWINNPQFSSASSQLRYTHTHNALENFLPGSTLSYQHQRPPTPALSVVSSCSSQDNTATEAIRVTPYVRRKQRTTSHSSALPFKLQQEYTENNVNSFQHHPLISPVSTPRPFTLADPVDSSLQSSSLNAILFPTTTASTFPMTLVAPMDHIAASPMAIETRLGSTSVTPLFNNLSMETTSPVGGPIRRRTPKFSPDGFSSSSGSRKSPQSPVEDSDLVLTCPHPGCGKTFSKQFSLNSHLVMHKGTREFSCDLCGQAFARNHDLLRHKRTVHCPDRPFKCETCYQTFSTEIKLTNHVKRMHTLHSFGTVASLFKVAEEAALSGNLSRLRSLSSGAMSNSPPLSMTFHPTTTAQTQALNGTPLTSEALLDSFYIPPSSTTGL